MKKTYCYALLCLSLFSFAFVQSINGQNKADKINELVTTYADYGKFNGSVLVAEEGKVIYKKAFGMANMEWSIPNQTDTKFRLASVTKQFTAMLIMQLVSEEKIALDTPISTYLPEYPKENGDKINIHHLLTHTSGIPNFTSFPNYRELMRNPYKPTEIINIFADSTLQFIPGERYSYSNSGYVLLGVIIEQLTGKPYGQVLKDKILTPLKMTNTGFDNNSTVLKNRANAYYQNAGNFVNANYIDMSLAYSAGGMYSTVEDLFLWDQALYTDQLLPQKYLDLIFTKHIPAWGQHYGYGWLIGESSIGNTEEKMNTINHDGVVNGFSSLILRIPTEHSSIIFLNNTGGAPLYEMSKAISGILYHKTYDLPKKSVANSLLEIIETEGITKGLEYFYKVKDDSAYYLDEREMNMVSYHLLQADKAETAEEVLKLGLEAFPNAFNLYDSYGEVLVALGKNDEAIKNYKKSLALNPKNDNGITMLKQLGVEIDRENLYLVKTDDSWTKEIFIFPLNFAPALKYLGTEEAHFPKGWRKQESNEFWSYVFAWNVNQTTELAEKDLETNLQIYFDGLANVVNKNKSLTPPSSVAKFHRNETKNGVIKYTGTLKIFDAFVTNEIMKLNVLVESHYCDQKKQYITLYKFSPKEFGTDIWDQLNSIKFRNNFCE